MEDKAEKFLETKEDVLNCLGILHFNLDKCIDKGMIDTESVLYNNIESIVDEMKMVNTDDELEELITQAKTIENQIDAYLISKGETTMSISWPSFA